MSFDRLSNMKNIITTLSVVAILFSACSPKTTEKQETKPVKITPVTQQRNEKEYKFYFSGWAITGDPKNLERVAFGMSQYKPNGMNSGRESFQVLDVTKDGARIRIPLNQQSNETYVREPDQKTVKEVDLGGDIFVKGLTSVFNDREYAGPLRMKPVGSITYTTITGAIRRIPAFELWVE